LDKSSLESVEVSSRDTFSMTLFVALIVSCCYNGVLKCRDFRTIRCNTHGRGEVPECINYHYDDDNDDDEDEEEERTRLPTRSSSGLLLLTTTLGQLACSSVRRVCCYWRRGWSLQSLCVCAIYDRVRYVLSYRRSCSIIVVVVVVVSCRNNIWL
jgi:hypothetical protein